MRILVVFLILLAFGLRSWAQSFSFDITEIHLGIVEGVNHLDRPVSFTASEDFDLSSITVSSESEWVTGVMDVEAREFRLQFDTSNLPESNYLGRVTARFGDSSAFIDVRTTWARPWLRRMESDPFRPRLYAIHENIYNELSNGSIVVYDTHTGDPLGNITVGRKPRDLSISKDGSELMVLNETHSTINVIDLDTLTTKEIIPITRFRWAQTDVRGNIEAGPDNKIYYVDGRPKPQLHVYDRTTGSHLQSLRSIPGDADSGFGDVVVNKEGTFLYGWTQYSSATGEFPQIVKYKIEEDGHLTFVEISGRTRSHHWHYGREDKPALISAGNDIVICNNWAVAADDVTQLVQPYEFAIFAASPGMEIVCNNNTILDGHNGEELVSLPGRTTAQAITHDYRYLYFTDRDERTIERIDLWDEIGFEGLGRSLYPAEATSVLSPKSLEWEPVEKALGYHVYLSTDPGIAFDTLESLSYLGQAFQAPRYLLSEPLSPGTNYYWRVDVLLEAGIQKGSVNQFRVSPIIPDQTEIITSTLQGFQGHRVPLSFESLPEGESWNLSSNVDWISFSKTSGVTPAFVDIHFDAKPLSAGTHTAQVILSDGGGEQFRLPIKLRVVEIHPFKVVNDSKSPFVYAISEDFSDTTGGAILLEYNTVNESISRILEVGEYVTDLVVHHPDNRIYVSNRETGKLLGVGLDTFVVEKEIQYEYEPGRTRDYFNAFFPGGKDRLFVLRFGFHGTLSLFDLSTETELDSLRVRKGTGSYIEEGNRFFFGETEGSSLWVFDVGQDLLTEVDYLEASGLFRNNNHRFVLTEDGNRLIWQGLVWSPDLRPEWDIHEGILTSSWDGRFAFSEQSIFDVDQQRRIGDMPNETWISAFNSYSGKLIYATEDNFEFLRLNDSMILTEISPQNGSAKEQVDQLHWEPVPGALSYHVYLGDAHRGPDSLEFIGGTSDSFFDLSGSLNIGRYLWRVNAVTSAGKIKGDVYEFSVSTVIPDQEDVYLSTVRIDRPLATSIGFNAHPQMNWRIDVGVEWLRPSQTNVTGPASIEFVVDSPQDLPLGISTTEIGIRDYINNLLFEIPVTVKVDPLHLTVLKSAPNSSRLFAVSQDLEDDLSSSYLLQINSETEVVEEVIEIGSTVNDLAIHTKEGRLYEANSELGLLNARSLNNLEIEQSYLFNPATDGGFVRGDIHKVYAGKEGRLIIEEARNNSNPSIMNTDTGEVLDTIDRYFGNGMIDPSGQFFYFGNCCSNDGGVYKYSLQEDQFAELQFVHFPNADYHGSGTTVVSEDGQRVFWYGTVMTSALEEELTFAQDVFSVSGTGRFVFGERAIYDVLLKRHIMGMPEDTKISAFNTGSNKLVAQVREGIEFFSFDEPLALQAPKLSLLEAHWNWIDIEWKDASTEQLFYTQYREVGTDDWIDGRVVSRNETVLRFFDLEADKTYEMRVQAHSAAVNSDWSNAIQVTVPRPPPSSFNLAIPEATPEHVKLTWSDSRNELNYYVQKRVPGSDFWHNIKLYGEDELEYVDTSVVPGSTYYYRVLASNLTAPEFSTQREVYVPFPPIPGAPTFFASASEGTSRVRLTWADGEGEEGYYVERFHGGRWTVIATLGQNVTEYIDSDLIPGSIYNYRVSAFNIGGVSDPSEESVSSTVLYDRSLVEDDFDPSLNVLMWGQIIGGEPRTGSNGFLDGNALRFDQSGDRSASTVGLNLSGAVLLEFDIRAGNETVDGWNNLEMGDELELEYSLDGNEWVRLQFLGGAFPELSEWTSFSISIPSEAFSPSTRFRWRQINNGGVNSDIWGLESIRVRTSSVDGPLPPDSVQASVVSDRETKVAWDSVPNANHYYVERAGPEGSWVEVGSTDGLEMSDLTVLPGATYDYRVRAVNSGGYSGYAENGTITTLTQLEGWQLSEFGIILPDEEALLSGSSANGVSNLLRYAFNLGDGAIEMVSDEDHLIRKPRLFIDPDSGRVCIEFDRRKAMYDPGIEYLVEFSCDLGNTWRGGGTEVSREDLGLLWERIKIADTMSLEDCAARFARIRIDYQAAP